MSVTERNKLRRALMRSGISLSEIRGEETLELIKPSYGRERIIEQLHPRLREALTNVGVDHLYSHQAESIKAGLDNKTNVVLQAPTASGKTLAFHIPVLNSLLNDCESYGLFIYPMKALAFDQRIPLEKLNEELGGQCTSFSYDGDTPREDREALRKIPPRIIFTNPEMLNATFLGHSHLWTNFLVNLRWVVIDEMHEYRGYFGSNVALLIRRFIHKLRQIQNGTQPQFFLCSATCANAQEHAVRLTGLQFKEVNAAKNFRPTRDFFFIQPDNPQDGNFWSNFQERVVLTALNCLNLGKQLIVFGPTRKFVEDCYSLSVRNLDEKFDKLKPENIAVFRGGLSPEDRQQIQDGLKNGRVKLVFSTNALELGIDIGGLDGVILAGFPDTIMAAWQRVGRAGRNWCDRAFIIYFALNRPLDVFYANNLEAFLNKPLDQLVVNPENKALAERHLPALLHECTINNITNINNEDLILGRTLGNMTRNAEPVQGMRFSPHSDIPFRGIIGGQYKLFHAHQEIGVMSAGQQFREAYIDAIYLHGGRTYRVQNVQKGRDLVVELETAETHLRTYPFLRTFLNVTQFFKGYRWDEFEIFYGKVKSNEVLQRVRMENVLTGEVLREWEPPITEAKIAQAEAVWVKLRSPLEGVRDGLHGLQHMFRVGIQFIVPADLHDIFSHASTDEAYIVESYPGGIGVAEVFMNKWRDVLDKGLEIAENCQCESGCPSCILPPRTPDSFNKHHGIELAKKLLEAGTGNAQYKFANGIWKKIQGAKVRLQQKELT